MSVGVPARRASVHSSHCNLTDPFRVARAHACTRPTSLPFAASRVAFPLEDHTVISLPSRRFLLLLSLLTVTVSLQAQTLTSATVVGSVVDASGAAVPGASIHIRQPETDSQTMPPLIPQATTAFHSSSLATTTSQGKRLGSHPSHCAFICWSARSSPLPCGSDWRPYSNPWM